MQTSEFFYEEVAGMWGGAACSHSWETATSVLSRSMEGLQGDPVAMLHADETLMSLPIAGSRRYAEKLFLKWRCFPRGNAMVFKLSDGAMREIVHSSYPEQSKR